jgi:hypothetical protein
VTAEVFGSLPAWSPACMDADELAGWDEMNRRTQGGRAQLPCADCLVGFAAEMRAVGRCNGTPGGVEEDEDMGTFDYTTPDVVTVVPTLEAATAAGPKPLHTHAARVELALTAPPCGSCAHEPICALRAAFEGMATVETSAPPLPDGLRLALVATVECSHFLRDKAKPAPVRALTSQERGQANGAGAFRASKPSTADWTPERRAAQGERMRARAAAAREGGAAG